VKREDRRMQRPVTRNDRTKGTPGEYDQPFLGAPHTGNGERGSPHSGGDEPEREYGPNGDDILS